jgi:hypothetical protein
MSCPFRHAFRQVFGLAGCLIAPASQFMAEPVLLLELSFLLTAAGQFRIYTGFPFKSAKKQTPQSTFNIVERLVEVNIATSWRSVGIRARPHSSTFVR